MNNIRRMILDHDFYCTCCGKKGIPVSRDKRRARERGHLKKLYCLTCNKEVNHVEVIENSKYDKQKFNDEFQSGNFDSQGNRVIPLSEWEFLFYGTSDWTDEKEQAQENDNIDEWLEIFQGNSLAVV